MKLMFNKIKTLFAVLIIIICGAANADYEDVVIGVNPEPVMQAMDMILDGNVYEIQQETSKMEFRVDSPIGDVWASFQDFEGRFLMLNGGRDRALASIDINAGSLDTDGGLIGAMLKSENFFDVENFPSMHFVGSSFDWYSARRAVLKGHMTIKNITREVAFFVELVDADVGDSYSDRITVVASTTIRRSAFGIDSLLPAVSDNVNLFMSIDALKRKDISVSMR
jgi:polyisoprenoid-binding protein YceI